MNKQMKELVKDLKAQGFEVTATKGGHYKVTHPDMKGSVIMPGTPSDRRSLENALGYLRRIFNYTAPWKR